MNKTKKYESIDLVKTDYDNFKNLAFFINQYKKAQEMIKEVENFYQSFLQSKLLSAEEVLKDEFTNFINLEKNYETEWRSSKYGTYDIHVNFTVISDMIYSTKKLNLHQRKTSEMEEEFWNLNRRVRTYANSLKENPDFKHYFAKKEGEIYVNWTDISIHDDIIKHVNEHFKDEINSFISKHFKNKNTVPYYYFFTNIRVPIHFCDSEKSMKKADFVLNEKENLMHITIQKVDECQAYAWPSDGPTLRTTITKKVSFDTNTNEYVSHDISSHTDEISNKRRH